jgi:ABC-type antimicrobial peptide transport system permease subunit
LKHLLPVAVTGPAALSSTAITIAAACPLAMILIAWASLAFLRTTGEVVAINRQGEITTAGLRSLRRVMAMSMSAVAAATLLAAGFAVGEIRQISNANLGFDATDVYAAELRLTHPRFSAPPAVPLFVRDVAERVRALPGVSALSLTSAVPIVGPSTVTVISRHGTRIESEVNYVDPTFFSMLGIAATKGRVLSPKDTTGVAVISERFARAAFGDEDPLGQVFTPRTRVEVIGVVGNVVTRAGMRGLPQVYLPFEPRMRLWLLAKVGRGSFGDTDVRRVVASLDPVQPVERVVDLSASVSDALRARRTVANAVIGLALLTWLVAGVALYGGIIHAVMERRTDIGVRLALGGAPRRVGFMLAWRELRLVSIGVAAGLASMVPVRRLVESVLFGVHDVSPQLVGAVVGGLLVVSVAACAYPIARAVRSAPQRLIGYFN